MSEVREATDGVAEATDCVAEVTLNEVNKHADEIAEDEQLSSLQTLPITIGATVPTGFESMAADEVKEKLGYVSRISKDRGKIYFDISVESLSQVHRLRSVDNLFVIVQEFADYQFKDTKDAALEDLQQLAGKLPWERALDVWRLNNSVKKKKIRRKKFNQSNGGKVKQEPDKNEAPDSKTAEKGDHALSVSAVEDDDDHKLQAATLLPDESSDVKGEDKGTSDNHGTETEAQVIKFRVTCNRAGDKHSFSSNEAARDFGGAVQEHFQWKADMTKFDVEVLLNINYNEVVVGIALTEESLHRRNITHFGPTTLRSTLAYGMLRLCEAGPGDIIIDPMCGTGAIPIEGVSEWSKCFFVAADNNPQAVKRAAQNIESLLRKHQSNNRYTMIGGFMLNHDGWRRCKDSFSNGRRKSKYRGPYCGAVGRDVVLCITHQFLEIQTMDTSSIAQQLVLPDQSRDSYYRYVLTGMELNDVPCKTFNASLDDWIVNTCSDSSCGLPIDAMNWDIFNLPLRTGSVDVIVTDMPFGKRIGSKRKNWDLYPAFLREMSRVCKPGTGRAVLLTHDKKCFVKALAQTGHLWRKSHTVWVNVGGLHAGVFLLRRTANNPAAGCSEKQVYKVAAAPRKDGEGDRADH